MATVSFEVYTCFFSHSDEVQADVDLLLGSDKVAQQRSSALFLLKLKEFRKLSQVAIDDIVQEWNGLFYEFVHKLSSEISFVSTFINLMAVEHDEVVFSDLSVAVPW